MATSRKQRLIAIRNFLGVNRRDGGDLVDNRESYTLQNFYPKTKGLLYKRFGSTYDLQSSDAPLASKIVSMSRYFNAWNERLTLYYCLPDNTAIPTPSSNLTISEGLAGTGDIYDGGAATALTIYYTYVGSGFESPYHSQSYTPSANNKAVIVTAPAFPTGVKSINVFVLRGTAPVYVGSIYTSAGSLTISCWIGPTTSVNDPVKSGTSSGYFFKKTGNLKKGVYYVSFAWVADSGSAFTVAVDHRVMVGYNGTDYTYCETVRLDSDNSGIEVGHFVTGAAAPGGAKYVYVFIGQQPPHLGPMMFAGIIKTKNAAAASGTSGHLTITDLKRNSNAQTMPRVDSSGTVNYSSFFQTVSIGTDERRPFILAKNEAGSVGEILLSRSFNSEIPNYTTEPNPVSSINIRDYYKDRQIYNSGSNPVYFTSWLGRSFIANGSNLLMQTDGYSMAMLTEKAGTKQPGPADSVNVIKNQLIITTPNYRNQIFGCNAYDPTNWSDGGTGTALRYATVGDPYGDGVKGTGIFSFDSSTDGPKTGILAFKKSSIWFYSSIPDSTSGVRPSMEQISGRVGCYAPATIVNCPNGVVFLGNDGNTYLIRGIGEPVRIGTRITLDHLVGNDTLMALCSAVYHDGFYKLCYPKDSASTTADAQYWADMRTEGGSPITWSGPHTGIAIAGQIVNEVEGDNGYRYGIVAGSASTVRLDDTSTYQDLGTDITSVFEWKTTRFASESQFKRFLGLHADVYFDASYAHELKLEAFMDEYYAQITKSLSSGSAVYNSSDFDESYWGDAIYKLIPIMLDENNLNGQSLRYKLTHANPAPFIMAAHTLLLMPERRLITWENGSA